MKGIMLLLHLLIQVHSTPELILQNELICKWKIEKVHITRPGVCILNDFTQLIGSTFRFNNEHLLHITLNNDWFSLNNNQLYWFLEDEHLIIKSKNTQEDYRLKITFEKGKLTLQISNMIAIRLVNDLGPSP